MIEGKGARRRNEVSVFFHNHGVMKEALRDRSQERGMSRVSYWLRRYKPSACMIDPGDNTWPNDMQLIPQAFATSKHAHIIFSYNVNETEWKIMLGGSSVLLSPVPLGLNFHTLQHAENLHPTKLKKWGEVKQSFQAQYELLCATRRAAAMNYAQKAKVSNITKSNLQTQDDGVRNRLNRILAPFVAHPSDSSQLRNRFHSQFGWPSRWDIWQALNETGVADLTESIQRRNMWKLMGQYAIVASPPGHGMDCHRTWEAIAMGAIVLVHSSPLDGMFASHELPVVPMRTIEDWRTLDVENIISRYALLTTPSHISRRLSTDLWIDIPLRKALWLASQSAVEAQPPNAKPSRRAPPRARRGNFALAKTHYGV